MIRILVIQNSVEAPVGTIGETLAAAGAELQVMDILRGDSLAHSKREHFDGLIVLGGAMGPHCEGEFPRVFEILELIRHFYCYRLPYLGICMGAQLFARAMGMPARLNQGWEIGFEPARLTADGIEDSLLQGTLVKAMEELPVFHLHQHSFHLPEGARLLMTGENCRNQAFRLGNYAYGFQFHPEVTEQIIADWACAVKAEAVDSEEARLTVNKLLLNNERCLPALNNFSREFAARWLALVQERKMERAG